LLGVAVFALTRTSMVDDAYITLTYAKTLGLHGEWGMVEGLQSNTATSPLNVQLLGGATALVRDAVLATGVVLVLLLALAGWLLHRIGEAIDVPPWRSVLLGLLTLATSPLLLSTVGLESYLAAVLVLAAVAMLLERRPVLVGVVGGLLVLTRPDLLVFGGLAVLVAGRGWWKAALAALGVTVPWFAWSWWNLGSAVPDSVLLKAGMPWGHWNYWTGPELWWTWFPLAVALTAVPAAVGMLAIPFWIRRRLWPAGLMLGGGAIAHAALFVAMETAPFHWYYAPAASGLALLAALSIARLPGRWFRVLAPVSLTFVVVCGVSVANDGIPRDRAPIGSNWASARQYQAIAAELPRGSTVQSPGEIGTLAYYCDCRVLDSFADPGQIAVLLHQRRAAAAPTMQWLLDLNYQRFEPGPPQRIEYTMPVWALPPDGAPMVGSWGDGRGWALLPVEP
jgi:hypothetical protein